MRPQSFALFGANVGVFAMILYTGRRFYASTARRALGLPIVSEVDTDSVSVLGLRIFLATFVLLVVQLVLTGVDVEVAIPYLLFMIMGFVVMGRIIAETGLIYMKCYFWPCSILWGLLGIRVLGTQQVLLLTMISTILFIDPREALLPFMVNSLKVLKLRDVPFKKPALWSIVALVIGLGVAVPSTLYFSYRNGSTGDSWAVHHVAPGPFDNAANIEYRLSSIGETVDETTSTLFRLGDWQPNWLCVGSAGAGLVLVLVFAYAAQRFTNFPFHPLLFVTWASTPLRLMGGSFFLGWLIKVLVVRYGGARAYNKAKPIMYGLIAGEIMGGVLPIVIGTIYYLVVGKPPQPFSILP